MAHNLSSDNLGYNVALRKPAWHNLGVVFSDSPDLVEAFSRARLNYNLELVVSQFEYKGKMYKAEKSRQIVREPIEYDDDIVTGDPISLGEVSKDYYILQNSFLAEAFNSLSKRWPVESAGALGSGEKIFWTLDAGMVEINGQEVHQYFTGTDNKTGEEKTTFLYSPTVVVCQNTMLMATKSAVFTMNIRHSKGNEVVIRKVAGLADRMQAGVDQTNTIFADMGKAKFSIDDFRELLKYELYPEPEVKPNVMEIGGNGLIDVTKEISAMKEHQEACVSVMSRYNDEHSNNANTPWAGLMAVTEYEEHIRQGRGVGNYSNVMFGARSQIIKNAFAKLSVIS